MEKPPLSKIFKQENGGNHKMDSYNFKKRFANSSYLFSPWIYLHVYLYITNTFSWLELFWFFIFKLNISYSFVQ